MQDLLFLLLHYVLPELTASTCWAQNGKNVTCAPGDYCMTVFTVEKSSFSKDLRPVYGGCTPATSVPSTPCVTDKTKIRCFCPPKEHFCKGPALSTNKVGDLLKVGDILDDKEDRGYQRRIIPAMSGAQSDMEKMVALIVGGIVVVIVLAELIFLISWLCDRRARNPMALSRARARLCAPAAVRTRTSTATSAIGLEVPPPTRRNTTTNQLMVSHNHKEGTVTEIQPLDEPQQETKMMTTFL